MFRLPSSHSAEVLGQISESSPKLEKKLLMTSGVFNIDFSDKFSRNAFVLMSLNISFQVSLRPPGAEKDGSRAAESESKLELESVGVDRFA